MSGDRYSYISKYESFSLAKPLMIGFEDFAGERSGGSFAVGSANADEASASVAIAIAQFNFADNLYTFSYRFLNERTEDRNDGRNHHQIYLVKQCFGSYAQSVDVFYTF